MDPDISFKETKSLVCLFCGNVNMFGPIQYNTIQYNTTILLFHLISYETFTKYFHKHV